MPSRLFAGGQLCAGKSVIDYLFLDTGARRLYGSTQERVSPFYKSFTFYQHILW